MSSNSAGGISVDEGADLPLQIRRSIPPSDEQCRFALVPGGPSCEVGASADAGPIIRPILEQVQLGMEHSIWSEDEVNPGFIGKLIQYVGVCLIEVCADY